MVEYKSVSDAVRELVRERVHTVEHLQVLLWLRSHQADEPPPDVESALARELHLPLPLLQLTLEELVERELVSTRRVRGGPTRWRYAPGSPVLLRAVDELAMAYAESRVELLQLFSSNALERFRSGSLKLLADTFRVKRKKQEP